MAENINNVENPEDVDLNKDASKGDPKDGKPSVDELMEQLAELKAESLKQKASLDKALKEKGELTKTLRSKQTVEEQEAEARKEAEAQRQEEYEKTLAELNLMKATQSYSGILTDDKNIENIISAIDDKDHKGIALIIKSEVDKAVKQAQAEWLKKRPEANAGTGYAQMTKEQIMAISDRDERRKAIALNLSAFN